MRLKSFTVGLIIILVGAEQTLAQSNSCEDQLNLATEEYTAGRFYGIAAMLKPCLDRGFTREQRQRAYLLLTQTYLLLDDPIAAENSYLKLLEANPEFTTDPARDPIDVVYLSKKFTALPVFSLYAKIGPGVSVARVIHDVELVESDEPTPESYKLRITFQAEAGVEWHFYDPLRLGAGITLGTASFQFNEKDKFGRDLEESIERQTWFSVPLFVKYADDKGKFRPYGYLGYSLNLLMSDKMEFNIYNREPDGTSQDAESPTINKLPQRNVFNRSFFFGGGVKLKYGLDFLFAEARYSFGLSNIVNPNELYSRDGEGTSTDVLPYGHVDNYFRLDNLTVSIGYVRPLYKPRKLKVARTKGLLRFIKKQQ